MHLSMELDIPFYVLDQSIHCSGSIQKETYTVHSIDVGYAVGSRYRGCFFVARTVVHLFTEQYSTPIGTAAFQNGCGVGSLYGFADLWWCGEAS